MKNLEFMWSLKEIDLNVELIKLSFIIMMTYYAFCKITNIKKQNKWSICIIILTCPLIALISVLSKYKVDLYYSLTLRIVLVILINILLFKKEILYTIIITIISYCINYTIYLLVVIIAFLPNALFMIKNDYISLIIILLIYIFIIIKFFKMKRLKYGFTFLNNKLKDSNLSLLILNICMMILFLELMFQNIPLLEIKETGTLLIVSLIYMLIAIYQSFKLYYKQKQLVKNLEETEAELKAKNEEIEKLEKENLAFSKTSHSLAHKQKALEFKLNELMKSQNQDNETKENIKEELESLSKEMYKEPSKPELPKTDIPLIDNMLSYWQSECDKENIKFELQVSGNIHYMVNHLITEDELEIMLADHIKDAIIAIDSSNNENRSILVRLGKIDDIYSLYIYDSGVEFTKEVLEKLGKEPITTHKDDGGTGMGFMNTFDVLNKYKASLLINEMGKPSKDNYTKALIIRFDNTNDFKVTSYKEEKIK